MPNMLYNQQFVEKALSPVAGCLHLLYLDWSILTGKAYDIVNPVCVCCP